MSSETGMPRGNSGDDEAQATGAPAPGSGSGEFPAPRARGSAHRNDFADVLTGTDVGRSGPKGGAGVALAQESGARGEKRDRAEVIGSSGRWLAGWCLRFLVIAAAAWVLWEGGALIWSAVLPVVLALIVCTILWPITRKLRDWHLPPALAVLTTILGFFVIIGGIIATIAPSVVKQSSDLVDQGAEGIQRILEWVAGPPLNIESDQLNDLIDQVTQWVQGQASQITQTAISGASAATSAVVTLVTVLVLTFFFLKDGERFLPLLRRTTGHRVGWHLSEVLTRCWKTLGGFIRTQAIVSFIDAFFIGLGLVFLSVPLAGPLAIITFFGGFIPIVGAFAAGALAVLVALVANGVSTALGVLLVIVLVQQLEGNLLSPLLQSKAMNMHAAVVLLSVTVGGGIFGIVGAFLAVPAAAMITEVVRYLGDMGDLATGEKQVEDIEFATIMTRKKQERIEAENAKKGNLASRIFRRKKKDTAKDSVSG